MARFYREWIGLALVDARVDYHQLAGDGLTLWLVRSRHPVPGAIRSLGGPAP
jgi:hypothetical protein